MDTGPFAFASGVVSTGFVIASVFFLKFWTRTGDRLFLAFATAFALLAANQILSAFLASSLEERTWTYLLRLAGFSFLIFAILEKNFSRSE
jgi:membrane-associated PAP2 superfamily phosphatase